MKSFVNLWLVGFINFEILKIVSDMLISGTEMSEIWKIEKFVKEKGVFEFPRDLIFSSNYM